VGYSPELLQRWGKIRSVRAEVQKQLEEARVAGKIGSSLQAEVEIRASGDKLALLQSLQDDLRFVLITSSAVVTPVAAAADEAVMVTPSGYAKCERCWHYRDDVGRSDAGRNDAGRDEASRDGVGRDGAGRDGAGRDGAGRDDAGRERTGADAGHPGLCGRCVSNLYGAGEPRTHA
jgi:isoleucyl-tRNA synthetase